MFYWPYKRLELKQGTETYREKEASIMREHIPQSALQAVSFSYRCFLGSNAKLVVDSSILTTGWNIFTAFMRTQIEVTHRSELYS